MGVLSTAAGNASAQCSRRGFTPEVITLDAKGGVLIVYVWIVPHASCVAKEHIPMQVCICVCFHFV